MEEKAKQKEERKKQKRQERAAQRKMKRKEQTYYIPPNVAKKLKEQGEYDLYVSKIKQEGYKTINISDNKNEKGDIERESLQMKKRKDTFKQLAQKSSAQKQTLFQTLDNVLKQGYCAQIKRGEEQNENINLFLLELSEICTEEYLKENKTWDFLLFSLKDEKIKYSFIQLALLIIWSKCLNLDLKNEKNSQIKNKIDELTFEIENCGENIELVKKYYIYQIFKDIIDKQQMKNYTERINKVGNVYGDLWKYLKEEKKEDLAYLKDVKDFLAVLKHFQESGVKDI